MPRFRFPIWESRDALTKRLVSQEDSDGKIVNPRNIYLSRAIKQKGEAATLTKLDSTRNIPLNICSELNDNCSFIGVV